MMKLVSDNGKKTGIKREMMLVGIGATMNISFGSVSVVKHPETE